MRNYVGPNNRQHPVDYRKAGVRRWFSTFDLPLGYGLPAFSYRTPEEQGSGGGNHSTGRNRGQEQPPSRAERLILFLRSVTGDIENDPEVQYAYHTVEKAKKLDSNIRRLASGDGNPLEYDVFGHGGRTFVGERR